MSIDLLQNEPKRRQGGVFEYVSPSRLSCWLSCPLKWRFRYMDGIRSPATPSLFVGKTVHAGLEAYCRHRQLGVMLSTEDVTTRMLASWPDAVAEEEMQFESEADETKARQQSVDLVAAYLAHVSKEEPPPRAVEATMEQPLVDPFTGEDLGLHLLGVVDLILDEQGGSVIVDFKTSARGGTPSEISHEIQLTSYAYLFRQLEGREEAGLEIRSLIKTKTPRIEFHGYPARQEQHLRRFFAVIREYLDALDSGRFNYRPGWGCAMCEHRDEECRAWGG